jgi:aminotransferase EvaB
MIPFFDYRPLQARLRPELDEAIARVLDSGQLILGDEVRGFETEFAAYVGCAHGVGVNSGTDALLLSLRALGIGSGDEVITVANAGVPPVAAIRAVGASPTFVDVRRDSLLLDPELLEGARTDRTRAVIAVHLYGNPVDLHPTLDFTERHGLALIEDCAQAHGAVYHGRHVGGFGRVGCFSFYPTKNLGAYGDGGLCVTDDPVLAEAIRRQRMYGFAAEAHARVEGLNSRLDELQAALLRVKLRHLPAIVAERRALAKRYREALDGSGFAHPLGGVDVEHAYHLFVVRNSPRERWVRSLGEADIGHGVHYPEPVHTMEAYRFLGYAKGSLPESESACANVLSLPLFPGLDPSAVDRVADALLATP